MKKNLKQFGMGTLVALSFCVGKLALAGERGGNGGGSYVCYGAMDTTTHVPKIISVQSLDLWEGRNLSMWKIDFDPKSQESLEYFMELGLKRIAKFDPLKADELRKIYKEFMGEVHYADRVAISRIFDATILIQPREKNCEIVQAAFQRKITNTKDFRFVIDKEIWNAMPSSEKAGLILHEIIYLNEIKKGATSSDQARNFVRFAASKDSEAMSVEEYVEFANSESLTNISIRTKNGIFRYQGKLESYQDGNIYDGETLEPRAMFYKSLAGVCRAESKVKLNDKGEVKYCSRASFKLKEFEIVGEFDIIDGAPVLNLQRSYNQGFTAFDPNGVVTWNESMSNIISISKSYYGDSKLNIGGTIYDSSSFYKKSTLEVERIDFYNDYKAKRIRFSTGVNGPYGHCTTGRASDAIRVYRIKASFPDGTKVRLKTCRDYEFEFSESGAVTKITEDKDSIEYERWE